MECRKITFRFKRRLNSDESNELIAYFKGMILKMKDTLKGKRKTLASLGWVAAKFDQHQVSMIEGRIDALLSPVVIDGRETSQFERFFSLDFEETEPLLWHFTYPHPQVIFGMAGVMGQMRKRGINTDSEDRMVFRNLLKEAKLDGLLDEMTVGITERELK